MEKKSKLKGSGQKAIMIGQRLFISKSRILLILLLGAAWGIAEAQEVFTAGDVMKLATCSAAALSPDGKWVAYTVRVGREVNDKPGGDYSGLYLLAVAGGEPRPFISGKVNVSDVKWRPDGRAISFLMRREEGEKNQAPTGQVWMIPADGGEAEKITSSETGVIDYQWLPQGDKIAFIATRPETEEEKDLKEKGYNFIFYEENLKMRNLYLQDVSGGEKNSKSEILNLNVNVWDFVFSPDGKQIVFTASEQNLIDQHYMFRSIYLFNLQSKEVKVLIKRPWKLGNYAISPDGAKLVYAAALDSSDHAVSQVYMLPIAGGEAVNLTIPNFKGHVEWVGWKDKETIIYQSGEGVWPTLRTVRVDGKEQKMLLDAKTSGIIFDEPGYTDDFKNFIMTGNTPTQPGELYYWQPGQEVKRLTELNPWLEKKTFGEQQVIRYAARDGQEVEGLLIYPVGYKQGEKYPLIVYVHGGPEAHYSNGWNTRYANPGQVFAGMGYFVFYPNYRSSTGYGLKFAKAGYGDPAGKEFDDIADGIDYLVNSGFADRERVGLAGGSYGGYAAAWFGTYYTKYVKAVHMFVGISDLVSKRSSTDIPWEDLYVHMGKTLDESWEINLKRSPIYYAAQSRTAFLICGGTDDTRVNPGQSLELYRRLKMTGHPAVRYVQYPGEGHGNSKQSSKMDFMYRQIEWFNWYVRDAKALEGLFLLLDISKNYGLSE